MDFNDGGGEESQLHKGRKGKLQLLEKGFTSLVNDSLVLSNS